MTRIMHSPWASAATTGIADMVSYPVPSGAITFAAGTIQFSWGLDDFGQSAWPAQLVQPALQQLTRNVLARFAMPPAPERGQSPLVDDFAGEARDPRRWRAGVISEGAGAFDTNIAVAQQAGKLTITPRTRSSGLHHNGYVSARTWDMTDGVVSVELAQVLDPASAGDTTFALSIDATHWVRFTQESQSLLMQSMDGTRSSQSVAYDPVQHRVLRLRHARDTGELLWEASPDGVQFTLLRRWTNTLPVSAMWIELEAGTFQSAVTVGSAQFDNLRFTHSGFVDSFESYRKPELWRPNAPNDHTFSYAGARPPVQSGGVVRLQPPAADGSPRGNGYVSARLWNLRDGEAVAELSAVPSGAAATVFALEWGANHWLGFRVANGQLECLHSISGVETQRALPLAHDASAQRYLRIAHHSLDDSITWDTSPDGMTWTTQHTHAAPFSVEALEVALGVTSRQLGAASGEGCGSVLGRRAEPTCQSCGMIRPPAARTAAATRFHTASASSPWNRGTSGW